MNAYNAEEGLKCGTLIAHIILQAYNDAISPQAFQAGDATNIAQTEAIKFLTASRGEWRAHRNWLCTQIGIDGDALAEQVRILLTGTGDVPQLFAVGVSRFKQEKIDAARALYREITAPPPQPKRARPIAKPASPKDPPFGRNGPQPIPANASLLNEWKTNLTG